ncbi:hypothetical protein [Cardinium endosymbiont of Nabis limbatus]|uniref:hypothetical protein n=1 Tax=Cardinium endosymbiont of Nabis limbatus TaxID=3066217 RepID=UPI003AF34BB4
MIMYIWLHCLSLLYFISCNGAYLGPNNMYNSSRTIGPNAGQIASSIQSGVGKLGQFIDDFIENLKAHVTDLNRANKDYSDPDQKYDDKNLIRQLCDVFSTDNEKCKAMGSYFEQADIEIYNALRNTFLQEHNPDHMVKHLFYNQYKSNAPKQYRDAKSSHGGGLIKVMFHNIIDRIVKEKEKVQAQAKPADVSNQSMEKSDKNPSELSIFDQVVACTEGIIHFCFENDKDTTAILEGLLIDKAKCFKSVTVSKKTDIYQFLEDYFNQLKKDYYDAIPKKVNAALQSIEANISSLSPNDLPVKPLQDSIDRLTHTVYIYNGMRLLLHFYSSHNNMMLPRKSRKSVHTNPMQYCLNSIQLGTYLTDVYTALINLGMENSYSLTNLIEYFARIAKLVPEATKNQ